MKGAIIGDIIGCHGPNGKENLEEKLMATSCTYSDCTILTLGTAKALLKGIDAVQLYQEWGMKYAHAKTSNGFSFWLREIKSEEVTWRYGAAMRVSPLALTAKDVKDAEQRAETNARITHQNRGDIKDACAVAAAIFLAHCDIPKHQIMEYLREKYGYAFNIPGDVISIQGNAVETAIWIFLNTENLDDALKKASTMPTNVPVIASIAGELAHAFYKTIPRFMLFNAFRVLPAELVQVMAEFNKHFKIKY